MLSNEKRSAEGGSQVKLVQKRVRLEDSRVLIQRLITERENDSPSICYRVVANYMTPVKPTTPKKVKKKSSLPSSRVHEEVSSRQWTNGPSGEREIWRRRRKEREAEERRKSGVEKKRDTERDHQFYGSSIASLAPTFRHPHRIEPFPHTPTSSSTSGVDSPHRPPSEPEDLGVAYTIVAKRFVSRCSQTPNAKVTWLEEL